MGGQLPAQKHQLHVIISFPAVAHMSGSEMVYMFCTFELRMLRKCDSPLSHLLIRAQVLFGNQHSYDRAQPRSAIGGGWATRRPFEKIITNNEELIIPSALRGEHRRARSFGQRCASLLRRCTLQASTHLGGALAEQSCISK